jgi:hypothetical protein
VDDIAVRDKPVVPQESGVDGSGVEQGKKRGPSREGRLDEAQFASASSTLTPSMNVDAVVLDIDGVLVDVSDSYRRAIVETVARVHGETVDREAVQGFKEAGGFNNDWELTDAVALYVLAREEGMDRSVRSFTSAIEAAGGGLSGARTVVSEALTPAARELVLTAWDDERHRTSSSNCIWAVNCTRPGG